MNMMTLAGLIGGIILMVVGVITGGGQLVTFVNIASVLIVIGGTFSALLIAYPFEVFKEIPKHMKVIFSKHSYNPVTYIDMITGLAQEARKKGLLALEDKAEEIDNQFMKDSIMLIVDAIEPDRVKRILETQIEYIEQRHDAVVNFYEKGAALAPAFGMIGTLIGLINMLQDLSDPETLGAGMAIALITTLYGSVLANLVFTPFANKLQVMHDEEMLCLELVVEGVISIQAGENPRHIEEKLISYLPAKVRLALEEERKAQQDQQA